MFQYVWSKVIAYFGGLFSGRLDQSQIQSEFFFIKFSTSILRSWKSSSDLEKNKHKRVKVRKTFSDFNLLFMLRIETKKEEKT